MRSAKRLRIKGLPKAQEYPRGLASIFVNLFNSIH